MLELSRVTCRQGARALLEDVSLRLSPSDFIAVVGPNGAGKTTLLRAALGLLRPTSGTVRLQGVPLQALPERERARQLAWLPQRVAAAEPLGVLELVATARFRFREPRAAALAAARAALERVQAGAFAARDFTRLSGGEQQRVALAALLAQEAPLLLLDEPASSLDPAWQVDLYRLIGDLWRAGLGVLCVTHDVNVLAHAVAPEDAARLQVLGMEQGRIRFLTSYAAEDLGERLGELFGVRMSAFAAEGRRVFVGGLVGRRA